MAADKTSFSLTLRNRKKAATRAASLLDQHRREVDKVVNAAEVFSAEMRSTLDFIRDPKLRDSASR